MIKVTLLNGQELIINAELIEMVEAPHDTIITLTTGRKIAVRESAQEVIDRITLYRQLVHGGRTRS